MSLFPRATRWIFPIPLSLTLAACSDSSGGGSGGGGGSTASATTGASTPAATTGSSAATGGEGGASDTGGGEGGEMVQGEGGSCGDGSGGDAPCGGTGGHPGAGGDPSGGGGAPPSPYDDLAGCELDGDIEVTPSRLSKTDGCEAHYACDADIELIVICDGENDGTGTSLCECHIGDEFRDGGVVQGEGETACEKGYSNCLVAEPWN